MAGAPERPLSQSAIRKKLELGISEISGSPILGIDRKDSLKTADMAREALNYLDQKGWIRDDYPNIDIIYYNDVERLIDLQLLSKNLERSFEETLADTSINRVLSISPTSRCETNCLHCQADSKASGSDLDYTVLEKADPNFFRIFTRVHFGIEGNPLILSGKDSAGKAVDISDYMALLYKLGLRNFTLDAKTTDNKTLKAYHKIKDFFRSVPDASFAQKISFNLYSPHIYAKENPLDDLKAEFLPLLHESLDFAQRVAIVATGSYKYTKAHILKTIKYLCEIMEEEGFYAVRQHWGKILYKNDPDYKEELMLGKKHLERTITVSGSRPNEKDSSNLILHNIINRIFGVGAPEGIEIIPTYFIHKKTGKKVEIIAGNTLNMGRWKNFKDKGEIDKVDSSLPALPRLICPAFLTRQIFLNCEGKIYSCANIYHHMAPIGNISQSSREIFANMKLTHKKTCAIYRQNIPGLVNGTFNNWECGMER